MNYLQIILIPIFSIGILYIISRLIGYRQMSQMSLFDYVNGITIGSIASEVAISPFDRLERPLIALLIYGVITFILTIITDKSIKGRRKITGTPIILLKDGKLYNKNFAKSHLDLSEFTMKCRNQGFFDISQLNLAIMEPNGTISVMPKSQSRPVTPQDMNFVIPQEEMVANIIMDGEIQHENLKNVGFNEIWLEKRLEENKIKRKDIFLATTDRSGAFNYYLMEGKYSKDTVS